MSLEKILNNLIDKLSEDDFESCANDIRKIASKVGMKHAKGLNWSHAENNIREKRGPKEVQIDLASIREEVSAAPLFSDENLKEILDINLDEKFQKRLNKKERTFLEVGLFLDKNFDINSTIDYLSQNEKNKIEKPGDLSKALEIDISSVGAISEKLSELTRLQLEWHEEMRDEEVAGDRYLTNEVVYGFDDGWKIVYVPAIGEGPDYKGDSTKSNDRTIEGNKCGLCLGERSGLYQDNSSGKIYSVRDPENNPKVTIRIHNNRLVEAKGKNNLPPGIEGVAHTKEWFELLRSNDQSFEYESNNDFKRFPPSSLEEAAEVWRRIQTSDSVGAQQMREDRSRNPFFSKGWITSWYRGGIKELDEEVNKAIEEGDYVLFSSEFAKKYPELCEPAGRVFSKKFVDKPRGRASSDGTGSFAEIVQIYKNKGWAQEDVKSVMKDRPFNVMLMMLELRIHHLEEFKEAARLAAQRVIDSQSALLTLDTLSPSSSARGRVKGIRYFHRFGLNKLFPDLVPAFIKSIHPKRYFEIIYDLEPKFEDEVRGAWLEATLHSIDNLSHRQLETIREYCAGAAAPERWSSVQYDEDDWYGPGKDLESGTRESLFRLLTLHLGKRDFLGILEFSDDETKRIVAEKLVEAGASALLFLRMPNKAAAGWEVSQHPPSPNGGGRDPKRDLKLKDAGKKTPTLAHAFPDLLTEDVVKDLADNSPRAYLAERSFYTKKPLFILDEGQQENTKAAVAEYAKTFTTPGDGDRDEDWSNQGLLQNWMGEEMAWVSQLLSQSPYALRPMIEGLVARSSPKSFSMPKDSEMHESAFLITPQGIGLEVIRRLIGRKSSESTWGTRNVKSLLLAEESSVMYKDILKPLFEEWAEKYPDIYLNANLQDVFMVNEYPEIREKALQKIVLKGKGDPLKRLLPTPSAGGPDGYSEGPYSEKNIDTKKSLKTIVDSHLFENPEYALLYATEYPDHFLHYDSDMTRDTSVDLFDGKLRQKYMEIAVENLAAKNPDVYFEKKYEVMFPEFEAAAQHALMKRKRKSFEEDLLNYEGDSVHPFDHRVDLLGKDVDKIPSEEFSLEDPWDRQIDEDDDLEKMSRKNKLLILSKSAQALPFSERNIDKNKVIRRFSKDLFPDDLYWHKDKEDRVVSKLSGEGWYYQEDNKLPILISSSPIYIKKNTWHRVIKGASDLVIEVLKINE